MTEFVDVIKSDGSTARLPERAWQAWGIAAGWELVPEAPPAGADTSLTPLESLAEIAARSTATDTTDSITITDTDVDTITNLGIDPNTDPAVTDGTTQEA